MSKKITRSKEPLAKSTEQKAKSIKLCVLFSGLCALCFVFIFAWSGFSYAQDGLKEKIPDLCYRCHKGLKESMSKPHVHFPFGQGRCTSCHSPHAGDLKGLTKENINDLCMLCHEGIRQELKRDFVHQAIKKGVCTDCHYAHSGDHEKLLVQARKDLCWTCHSSLKEQLNRSFVHIPFKDGECSSCHNSHASTNENLILASPNTLCKKCHSPRCKAQGVSIVFATEKLDCTSCHGGHASAADGLLGPYGHSDFLEKRCGECHNPFSPGLKVTTKISGRELCMSCHKMEPAKLKVDDVHIRDSGNGCAMCHSFHASKRKSLTVRETQICFTCHESTGKRTVFMEKALKSIRCVPVRERRCFECHIPPHSLQQYYFRDDEILACARCHKAQHEIAHPLGPDVKDPRNGQPITCKTCHSMHSAKAEFMLQFDRKRQLCIQCHKK